VSARPEKLRLLACGPVLLPDCDLCRVIESVLAVCERDWYLVATRREALAI